MMQSATQSTLCNLVEQHLISLIREAATINRHSKRVGVDSSATALDYVTGNNDNGNGNGNGHMRKRQRMIHHLDVNMALSWRGCEKLHVSINTGSTVADGMQPPIVPRVDLNAFLASDIEMPPPCELGLTLHWLAVDGTSPVIPMNEVWNQYCHDEPSAPDSDPWNPNNDTNSDSSIRIRELQHRLLSEELQLYYSRVTAAIESTNDDSGDILSTALHGIRHDTGIQELVPFLSRYVACGLLDKRHLRNTEYARKLVGVFDAMLDNQHLQLDLHLHQMFTPVGTCIVAKRLSSSPSDDHWSLREKSAQCLAKACQIYGNQYTTMKPRILKLLTKQALRTDRPLPTQYGGIVGISLFGPRAVGAFLLPQAQEYWTMWNDELEAVGKRSTEKLEGEREYELHMCQQALLNAIGIFLQNVTSLERVNISSLIDVFGERLIPLQTEQTEYMMAIL